MKKRRELRVRQSFGHVREVPPDSLRSRASPRRHGPPLSPRRAAAAAPHPPRRAQERDERARDQVRSSLGVFRSATWSTSNAFAGAGTRRMRTSSSTTSHARCAPSSQRFVHSRSRGVSCSGRRRPRRSSRASSGPTRTGGRTSRSAHQECRRTRRGRFGSGAGRERGLAAAANGEPPRLFARGAVPANLRNFFAVFVSLAFFEASRAIAAERGVVAGCSVSRLSGERGRGRGARQAKTARGGGPAFARASEAAVTRRASASSRESARRRETETRGWGLGNRRVGG